MNRQFKNKRLLRLGFILTILLSSLMAISQQKKNLLFIITDQQCYDALSYAGNTVLQTPNLDHLAKQGAWFKNAYTPCAVCAPARSSILTGTIVENHGVKTNERAYYYEEEKIMTMPTFDEILAENGYRCEYYGKWHTQNSHAQVYKNPELEANNGKSVFGPGGQHFIYMDFVTQFVPQRKAKPGELYDTFTGYPYMPNPLDDHFGMEAEAVKAGKKYSQPDAHGIISIPEEYTMTAFQAKQTIEAIERLKNGTFSITCSFHFPHAPMLPPKAYGSIYPPENMLPPASIKDDMENSPYKAANGRLELPQYSDPNKIKYMISNYYGLVKEIDDWVGKILETLDKNGLTENTLVIFTSDHGEMLGAHGLREKNVFYEESAHIPLIMRFPGEIKSSTRVDGYVSNVDLFATILDYLQIGVFKSNGSSLRDLIEGKHSKKHGEYVVTEWNYRGDIESNYMIVKNGWKLIIPYSKGSQVINAMYDLTKDPHEMNNLLGSNKEKELYHDRAEELRQSLLEWLKKNGSKHYKGVKERKLI